MLEQVGLYSKFPSYASLRSKILIIVKKKIKRLVSTKQLLICHSAERATNVEKGQKELVC